MKNISQNHLSGDKRVGCHLSTDSYLPMAEDYSGWINTYIHGFQCSGENPYSEKKGNVGS